MKDGGLEEKEKIVGGSSIDKAMKVVCGNCNNTWMARLEDSCCDTLINLAHGGSFTLSFAEQLAIARWAVMKTICFENVNENQSMCPLLDRQDFMNHNIIPSYYKIYCGSYDLAFPFFQVWNSGEVDQVYLRACGLEHAISDCQRHVIQFGFSIGKSFFLLNGSRLPTWSVEHKITVPGFYDKYRLYPPLVSEMEFPMNPPMTENDINLHFHTLQGLMNSPFWKKYNFDFS